MEAIEISGKTVEEAVQHALAESELSREQMKITVIREGRHGILGLGSEEALIRVEPLATDSGHDVTRQTREVLETLLDRMGIAASVTIITEPLDGLAAEDQMPVVLDIRGDDLGILIGRRGQTLACLQHIVRLIMAHQTRALHPIIIDVEGYKQHRYKALQSLANRIAGQVKSSGTPFTLEPMPAFERRIIHLTLADDTNVTTESTGVGDNRQVVIQPQGRRKR